MVGMCEAQRLWGREQKSQHPRGLRGSGELEISRKRCTAGVHSVEGVGAAGGVESSIKSPIAQSLAVLLRSHWKISRREVTWSDKGDLKKASWTAVLPQLSSLFITLFWNLFSPGGVATSEELCRYVCHIWCSSSLLSFRFFCPQHLERYKDKGKPQSQQNTRNEEEKTKTVRVDNACFDRNRILLYQESGGQGLNPMTTLLCIIIVSSIVKWRVGFRCFWRWHSLWNSMRTVWIVRDDSVTLY